MKVLFIGTELEKVEKVHLAVRLRWPDAVVLVASEVDEGVDIVERETPDVVIHQASPDDKQLTQFIGELRGFSDVPLIVLEPEGGGGEMQEVKALEAGADDYIRHTAGFIDLVARMVALMRRVWRTELPEEDQPLASGALLLNPATYEVLLHGKRMALTSTEFRLLHLLLKNRGTVATHRFLELALWGDRVDSSALVKKYIQRLRRKLGDDPQEPEWIANVYGVGYRFLGGSTSHVPEQQGVLLEAK